MVKKMIEQIIASLNQTTKDVLRLDILMNHTINDELHAKWDFTLNTYHNLLDSIDKYLNGRKEPIIKNYLINDNETLLQMIKEFKEDLYPFFDPNAFVLLDSLNQKELVAFQNFEKQLISKDQSFTPYLEALEQTDVLHLHHLIKEVTEKLETSLLPNEKHLIPFSSLEQIINIDTYKLEDYPKIYQLLNKCIKYLHDKTLFYDDMLEFKFIIIIIFLGVKNVRFSN